MSCTPTDEEALIAKAALALINAERDRWDMPPLDDMSTVDLGTTQQYRALARAVLVAVGPHIAASALRDAGPDLPGDMSKQARRDAEDFLNQRADQIEKEAGR